MLLGEVVPDNFFVTTWDLSLAVVGRGIPLNLLPRTSNAQVLNERQGSPSGSIGSVPVVAETGEIGRRSEVSKQTAKDGEGDWCILDTVVEDASIPVCSIVSLEVKPEGLLVASEIRPRRVIHRQVGFCTNEVGL